jgi:hypothetical protein
MERFPSDVFIHAMAFPQCHAQNVQGTIQGWCRSTIEGFGSSSEMNRMREIEIQGSAIC